MTTYRNNDPAPYATTTLAMQNKVRTMVSVDYIFYSKIEILLLVYRLKIPIGIIFFEKQKENLGQFYKYRCNQILQLF